MDEKQFERLEELLCKIGEELQTMNAYLKRIDYEQMRVKEHCEMTASYLGDTLGRIQVGRNG